MIHVLYATKINIGGWATFTRHLVDTLEFCGHDVQLWRIGANTENCQRPFGRSANRYRNVSEADLERELGDGPVIIAALGKHYVDAVQPLIKKGAGVVIHGGAESTVSMNLHKPWSVRRALMMGNSVFIRHPYIRRNKPAFLGKRSGAVATSRVDFVKNTTMILDANRLGAKINIVGYENRLYTKFKVLPFYPEWEQSKGDHPRTGVESFDLLQRAKFMVDLTDIKGDGGGTQYTTLEAWDAGAVPIIGHWWLRPKDDMVHADNCYVISDARELYRYARMTGDVSALVAAGQKSLARHHPKKIGPQIIQWLESL